MRNSLNENIKALRKLNGLSQVDFAAEMNVTKQCVSNWENDNVLPSIELLVRIASFFRVSTDFLLGREAKRVIDCTELTEEQFAHLVLIAKDFEALNK
jgi:transcriptional regulator with XRE-family HTH domain